MCLYSYHAYFILSDKSCYRKKWKTEPLKSTYWLGNSVLDSRWLNHLKWLMPDAMGGSSFFLLSGGGFGLFFASQHLAQTQCKNCDLSKVTNINVQGHFWLAQSQQNDHFKNIYISQVMEKLETSNLVIR